jgi:hypothetical protein
MLDQVAHHGTARLAAATCDDDPFHGLACRSDDVVA